MRVLKAIGAAILATASILGGIGSFAQWAGIEFTGVVGAVVGAAPAWLPIASLLFGILIGWNAKKWQAANSVADLEKRPTTEQMDAAIAEKDAVIAELRETASLEESHRQFLGMSWHAQMVCLAAFSGPEVKTKDGIDDRTPNPYRAEARDAGFVFVEACGIGKWRTVPTEKLETLMAEKPEIQQKVWEGVYGDMIGGCADEHEVSWKDVILIEGLGAVFPPEDAEEGQ